ncbi:tRNA (cytidine(34)-2'-O)-methyltransferase [Euphorbia peplus]|nr:tRNA (cytidine(34)-2'-O)-methyltransferase [Euphorbia peplus]
MDITRSFKTLNAIATFPFNFRSRSLLLRPLYFSQLKKRHLNSSLSCSLSETGNGNCLPHGAGQALTGVSQNKLLQVVLVSPQIPGNTGCIARTCAASAVGLHLVGPLGFQVDDTKLKRAGLDYWPYVVVKVHDSWAEFRDYFRQQDGNKRLLAFTKRGTMTHSEFSYRRGDYLVFGSETSGLPAEALEDCKNETFGGGTLRIPMIETYVRCLNLSYISMGKLRYTSRSKRECKCI